MHDSLEVQVDISDLIEAMRTDCVTFFGFYLEDELTQEVPDLHDEIWSELVAIVQKVNAGDWTDSLGAAIDHLQKVFCVPRGHAKSTLIKLAVILFMRYSVLSFTMYVSLTSPVAKAACKDIFNWLTSDRESTVYGKPTIHKANETEGLWELTIHTPDWGLKRILLKSLGSDQQVRGTNLNSRRPQLVIVDDCEDNSTASTDESQKKHDIWLFGNMLKASAKRSVRIWVGNMINQRTMLYRISKDPDWNPTVYGAIIRDKKTGQLRALWEGMFTLEGLLKEYKDYRAKGVGHVWIYEMMNMTQDTVMRTGMDGADRRPRPTPDQVISGFICIDPAFGENKWNDFSGITVHVKTRDTVLPWMVQSEKFRYSEEKLLDEVMALSYYWNITTWTIEANAAQKLLIPLWKALLKIRGIEDNLFVMLPMNGGGQSKQSRIWAFTHVVESGGYIIAEEEQEFVDELEKYDPESKDHEDRIDSGAYGIIVWEKQGRLVKDAINVGEALALMQDGSTPQNIHQSDLIPY
jgi:hypothetical protein